MERGVEIQCPSCGEPTALWVDVSSGRMSIESDCQVCCQPLHVIVEVHGDGSLQVMGVERGW
ncbi:MAG: CPXCG motif-containing cysteine-rich protein [Myxococcota bacterium]|nr:CPXCG motif-containing cysteine-rich protein [Myxococcota bacterium]